jgi:hypothetical protein
MKSLRQIFVELLRTRRHADDVADADTFLKIIAPLICHMGKCLNVKDLIKPFFTWILHLIGNFIHLKISFAKEIHIQQVGIDHFTYRVTKLKMVKS